METVTTATEKVRTEAAISEVQDPKAGNGTKRPERTREERHTRCAPYFSCPGFCCDDVKRIEIPEVGMMCFDSCGHNLGIVVKVVIGETEQGYVHYRDFFTGKVTLQYLDEIVLPPEAHRDAFQTASGAVPHQSMTENPFLQMYREFSMFAHKRLLPLYERLSDPNESLKAFENMVREVEFQIEANIGNYEWDISNGNIDPAAIPQVHAPLTAPAASEPDPFYSLFVRCNRIYHDSATAFKTSKLTAEDRDEYFAIESSLNVAMAGLRGLSHAAIDQENSGGPKDYEQQPKDVDPMSLLASRLLGISTTLEKLDRTGAVQLVADAIAKAANELSEYSQNKSGRAEDNSAA